VISRRTFLAGAALLSVPLPVFGQEALLKKIRAAKDGVIRIEKGIYRLTEPIRAENKPLVLIGVPFQTVLQPINSEPAIIAQNCPFVHLEHITVDGQNKHLLDDQALIMLIGAERFHVTNVTVRRTKEHGLLLRGGTGVVQHSRFEDIGETGLRAIDTQNLKILDNTVEACGNNGIQVWQSAPRFDGALIRGNTVTHIRADRGGTGPYGNGINVFRADGVTITQNTLRDCAFSSVRVNSGKNSIIAQNQCLQAREVAIFVEFSFEGAAITGNIIDGGVSGIQMVNFTDGDGNNIGGRLATCSGNVIRGLRANPQFTQKQFGYGVGIKAEADTTITGNVVEDAPWMALQIGFGRALRNIIASNNVLRGSPIGIGIALNGGEALVSHNLIQSARPIVGMRFQEITRDLDDGTHEGIRVLQNTFVKE
jgi:uncharacterized secreted repeat protein (TIGR03808 family)